MMKKNLCYTHTLVAVTLFSLFAISCQPKDDNEPEEATISLSAQTLMMDNQAQTPSAPQITFETNQSNVVVASNAEWLDAEVQGNGILITAMANELGHDRKANILVIAGGAADKITVTQSAADIVLDVSPSNRTIPNSGEDILVSVKSPSSTWYVEKPAVEWINVEKFTPYLLKISVLPNETQDTRETQIFAKLGTVTKQINIRQVGKGGEKFILPLLKKQPTQLEILDFEKARGNYLLRFTAAVPNWGVYEEEYSYACISPVFSTLTYTKDVIKDAIKQILMLSRFGETFKTQEFKDFLVENGFELGDVSLDGGYKAVHAESKLELEVNISPDESRYSYLMFTPKVEQIQPYPSFDSFPYDKSFLLNNPEWASAKIVESEKASNSEVSVVRSKRFEEFVVMIRAELAKGNRETPHTREYFIDTDEVKGTSTDLAREILVVWEDHTVGSWLDGHVFVLTAEFMKLMTDEGFEYFTESGGFTFYYNKITKMMLAPRGTMFTDVLDGAPVFAISYFIQDDEADEDLSSINDPILRNILIKRLVERVSAEEALLNGRN